MICVTWYIFLGFDLYAKDPAQCILNDLEYVARDTTLFLCGTNYST